MKKILRTLLAVMVAVIMSFTIVAFAGCNDENNNNNNNNNNENNTTVTPGLATGNKVYDSIIDTKFAGATLTSTTTFDDDTVKLNAKVNTNGTADIVLGMSFDGYGYYFVRDWAVYGTYSKTEMTDFTEAELEGYIDVNQAVEAYLEFVENAGVELPEGTLDIFDLDIVGDVAEETIGGVNYAILSLADAAGAATTADGKVTVDINKLVYNMLNDVKSVVNGLTETTTIGDVLNNATLKKYVQILTELATPQEVIEAFKELAEGFADGLGEITDNDDADETTMMMVMISAMLEQVSGLFDTVKPDANSSVYDYIVKILGSQELVDLVNGLLKNVPEVPAGVGLTKKITDFTLGEIVTMISAAAEKEITFSSVKELVNTYIETYTSGITATKFSISEDEEELFSFSNASVVYNYNDNGLTSMKVGMSLLFEGEDEMVIDGELSLSKTAYAKSEFATLPAELPEIEDVELGGNVNEKINVLEYGRNDVDLTAGEMTVFEIEVDPYYENLRIYSDEVFLIAGPAVQGQDITVENYDGLTITVYLVSDYDATVTIWIEEAEPEQLDFTELTLNVAEEFVTDGYDATIFVFNATNAGEYALEFTGCSAEELWITVGTEFDSQWSEIVMGSEIEADNGVYVLPEGTIYIVILSDKMDENWNYIGVEGSLTIRFLQA